MAMTAAEKKRSLALKKKGKTGAQRVAATQKRRVAAKKLKANKNKFYMGNTTTAAKKREAARQKVMKNS